MQAFRDLSGGLHAVGGKFFALAWRDGPEKTIRRNDLRGKKE
jgi:hypothetical protein